MGSGASIVGSNYIESSINVVRTKLQELKESPDRVSVVAQRIIDALGNLGLSCSNAVVLKCVANSSMLST